MSIRIGVVGAAGHIGYVLNDLPRFPQARFVAYAPSFAGEDVTRYAQFSTSGGYPKAYSDWLQMLDGEKLDVAVACGRHDLNGRIAIEAARRGFHVISEKPAAQTLEELTTLRRAVADHDVQYGIMLAMRYDALYYTAHQLVRQGVVGEPYLISAQKSYRWGTTRPDWYADPTKYGSSMTWIGIHAFDFARWVSGVDYVEVFAYHANLLRTERPGCQDVSSVIARLANGGSAVFTLDYLRPQVAPTHGDERLRIAGSKGILELCDHGERLHVITGDEDIHSWPLTTPQRTFFGDFVAAISGQGELLISSEDAFSISEFAIKAAHAADTGQVVRI